MKEQEVDFLAGVLRTITAHELAVHVEYGPLRSALRGWGYDTPPALAESHPCESCAPFTTRPALRLIQGEAS